MVDVVADAYATMAQFRLYVRNSKTTDATDPDYTFELDALEAAARAIDRCCGRQFKVASATTARYFSVGVSTTRSAWGPRFAIDIDDVFDLTGMLVKFDATGNGSYTSTTTAYRAMPKNAADFGQPYSSLLLDLGVIPTIFAYDREGVQVTAKWGWTTIPNAVVQANLLQAARFLKRRDSPYGVAGSPEMGNEMRLLARVDPDVAVMLAQYKNDWGNQ